MFKKGRADITVGPIKNPGNVLLSHGLHRSTIAAVGLNFRVRNGNGCDPHAMITEKKRNCIEKAFFTLHRVILKKRSSLTAD